MMSELPHTSPDTPKQGGDALILPFPTTSIAKTESDERLEPAELTPAELVDSFLSVYRHPSAQHREAAATAESIRQLLDGNMRETDVQAIPIEKLAWRQAFLKLSVDSMDLTIEQWEGFEKVDPVFKHLTDLRRDTKGEKDIAAQRKALEALQNFRLGIITRDIKTNEEDWTKITELLFS